jgi:hypothetical protein
MNQPQHRLIKEKEPGPANPTWHDSDQHALAVSLAHGGVDEEGLQVREGRDGVHPLAQRR